MTTPCRQSLIENFYICSPAVSYFPPPLYAQTIPSENDAMTSRHAESPGLHRMSRSHSVKKSADPTSPHKLPPSPRSIKAPVHSTPEFTPISRTSQTAAIARLAELERQTAELKRANRAWASEYGVLQYELVDARGGLYSVLQTYTAQRRQAEADADEIRRLAKQVARYEKLVRRMTDIGLRDDVLGRAHARVRGGEDVDVALVQAIEEAAAEPGSAWARLTALSRTPEVKKETRECKRLAKFWKHIERLGGPGGPPTPLPSKNSSDQTASTVRKSSKYHEQRRFTSSSVTSGLLASTHPTAHPFGLSSIPAHLTRAPPPLITRRPFHHLHGQINGPARGDLNQHPQSARAPRVHRRSHSLDTISEASEVEESDTDCSRSDNASEYIDREYSLSVETDTSTTPTTPEMAASKLESLRDSSRSS